MPSERRSRTAFLTVLLFAALVGISLMACREMTQPVQEVPEMIQARGFVHDRDEKPLAQAMVYVSLERAADGLEFSSRIATDVDGRFRLWVPNRPVDLRIDPPAGTPS